MDTEETKPSRIKKFLKITLGVLGTLAVLLSTAFVLTAMKNAKQDTEVQQPEVQTQTATLPPHVYTEDEKLQALEDFRNHSSSSTTSDAEKLHALRSFSAKAPALIPSDEEKRKALLDFATRIPLAQ